MRKHSTLLLLSAAALLLTATPTFAQQTDPITGLGIDADMAMQNLPGTARQWRTARKDEHDMLVAEATSCQLPDPHAVTTLSTTLNQIESDANDEASSLPAEGPPARGLFPIYAANSRAQDIASSAHAANAELLARAQQLPPSCSS
jgi:hypothetical protein